MYIQYDILTCIWNNLECQELVMLTLELSSYVFKILNDAYTSTLRRNLICCATPNQADWLILQNNGRSILNS